MDAELHQEKEFIIPTRYKIKVSSRLSWPIGALELTKQLTEIPQIMEIQLTFAPSYGGPQQGKWPVVFPVFETRYTHPPSISGHSDWEINIYPVPRNTRAKIREVMILLGFKQITKWFFDHAGFSGRASHLRFRGEWNSELSELNFVSHHNILPEISATC